MMVVAEQTQIGEVDVLPPGWAAARVEEFCTIVGGGTPSTSEEKYWHGSIPWITSADIEDVRDVRPRRMISEEAVLRSATNRVPAGSIIVATRVGLGRVALAPAAICFSQDCHGLVFDHDLIDPLYLAYYMKLAAQIFKHVARGTTISGVTKKQLAELQVLLPPTAEQRRIVAAIETHFTRLDAGLAALRRVQATLKRYRAAVLKAAVEGTLTEEWRAAHPDVEPASALLQRILHERRRAWEQGELARFARAGKTPPKCWQDRYKEPAGPAAIDLRELPETWCWATVGQLLVEPACNGISVKGSSDPPGVPALRLSAMSDSGFDYRERRYIPIAETIAESLRICAGDFFVARGNGSLHLVGRGTLAQEPPERVVFPDTMIRLRFAKAAPMESFIGAIWPSRLLRAQIERRARTTAGIYKISQRDIESFRLPLPPLAEQEQIVAEVERRLSVVAEVEAAVEAQVRRAGRLRQSILARAFAGKLVPRDPADEPAAVLLERIRGRRTGHAAPAFTEAVQLRLV